VASTRDLVPGFGSALRARREAAGLTQTQLATSAGTDAGTVSKVETSQRSLSLRLALELAKALGVKLDTLIDDAARLATETGTGSPIEVK